MFWYKGGKYSLSLFPILFLLGLRFCGVCLLSVGTEECRFKVKSDLLALQGLGRALEIIFCSKRRLCRRLRISERNIRWWFSGQKATSEFKSNILDQGIFWNKFLGLIPRVVQEELSSKVRLRKGINACLCIKVNKSNW